METTTSPALWFDRPGKTWFDGLPVGNGRTGAMVTGDLAEQTLALNEETFWSPGVQARDFEGAREALERVRELLAAHDVLGAQAAASALLGAPALGSALQPIGAVRITTGLDAAGATFRRGLDLRTGVVSFEWNWPDGRVLRREVVASRDPSVFVIRQRSSGFEIGTELSLTSPFGLERAASAPDALVSTGQWHDVPPNRHLVADSYRLPGPDGLTALRFAVGARLIHGEGRTGDRLDLLCAEWTVAAAIATDFAAGDPAKQVAALLAAADAADDSIFDRAIQDHRAVFSRASIELQTSDPLARQSTDRRVQAVRAGGVDDHLVLLLSEYGRYLQIASTYGGEYPPTLQGIWNEDTEPAWGSNYTLNINLQMTLWSADAHQFVEAGDVLLAFVERLAAAGRRTAREVYGADGWVVHHNSDVWCNTAPTTLVEVGLFAGAGLWLVQQVRQHVESHPDAGREARLLDLLTGLADFCGTWLVLDEEGRLVTSPSSTPENGYLLGSTDRPRSRAEDPEFWRHGWIGRGSTIEMLLVHDTLRTAIDLGTRLGVSAHRTSTWLESLRMLRPARVTSDEIPEWTHPSRPLELGHRHLSPLYGVYPGKGGYENSHEVAAAAKRTLLDRQAGVVSSSNGWGGWSRVWAAACWARLDEGDRALASLESLVRTGIAPDSLLHAFPEFDGHPSDDAVFQIDANCGLTAAVTELVLRSDETAIDLLPALPRRWTDGSVRRLRAHGGVDVSFVWREGRVATATLWADRAQTRTVTAPGPRQTRGTSTVVLAANVPTSVVFTNQPDRASEGRTP